VGGIVGGKLFALMGVVPDGWLVNLATAVVGALLLLSLLSMIRRSR
jgi:uncharacterized membrane protein YeaQ/YmgE (transglycosylase-associated protein family)